MATMPRVARQFQVARGIGFGEKPDPEDLRRSQDYAAYLGTDAFDTTELEITFRVALRSTKDRTEPLIKPSCKPGKKGRHV